MAKEDTKRFNYVAMAVTGIATMAYLAMYLVIRCQLEIILYIAAAF